MAFGHFRKILWHRPTGFSTFLQSVQSALQDLDHRQPVPVVPFIVQNGFDPCFVQGVDPRRKGAKGYVIVVRKWQLIPFRGMVHDSSWVVGVSTVTAAMLNIKRPLELADARKKLKAPRL
jgi:hypothetical protein